MAKIAILYCKQIKDHSCIACAKCYKGMAEKNGEFARYKDEDIEIVAMTDCGGCPGLTVPRVKLLKETTTNIGRPMEVVHLGTCVKAAMETSGCPLVYYEDLKVNLEKKFGVQVVWGRIPTDCRNGAGNASQSFPLFQPRLSTPLSAALAAARPARQSRAGR